MSRILRHISAKDLKRTHQKKLSEQRERAAQKLKEQQKEELERKQLEEIAKPLKSDWRKEFIAEKMSTGGLLYVSLDATDSSLQDIDISDTTSDTSNSSVSNGGGGTGYNTGLDMGTEMISISGVHSSTKSYTLGTFDTSKATTITFKSLQGDYNNGGMANTNSTNIFLIDDDGNTYLMDRIESNYDAYFGHSGVGHPDYPFKAGLFDTMTSSQESELRSDYTNTYIANGFQFSDQMSIYAKIVRFLGIQQQTRTHTITIPSFARGTKTTLRVSQASNAGTSWTNDMAFSDFQVKRTTPINVFVGLDEPEASSFMRMGDMNNLSAEERKQRLKEMLDAGNEWMLKLGLDPSNASVGDIELAVERDNPYQINWPRDSSGPAGRTGQYYDKHMKMWVPVVKKGKA